MAATPDEWRPIVSRSCFTTSRPCPMSYVSALLMTDDCADSRLKSDEARRLLDAALAELAARPCLFPSPPSAVLAPIVLTLLMLLMLLAAVRGPTLLRLLILSLPLPALDDRGPPPNPPPPPPPPPMPSGILRAPEPDALARRRMEARRRAAIIAELLAALGVLTLLASVVRDGDGEVGGDEGVGEGTGKPGFGGSGEFGAGMACSAPSSSAMIGIAIGIGVAIAMAVGVEGVATVALLELWASAVPKSMEEVVVRTSITSGSITKQGRI